MATCLSLVDHALIEPAKVRPSCWLLATVGCRALMGAGLLPTCLVSWQLGVLFCSCSASCWTPPVPTRRHPQSCLCMLPLVGASGCSISCCK
jgi:hypothetical protein